MGDDDSSRASDQHDAGARVRALRRADLGGLMRLKQSAGWNQTEQDWERLLELEPAGCFGLERDGAVVASSTALLYGQELAWIGMVLTLPEHRGQGYARRMMECAVSYAAQRGVARAGLDATDMGIALYRKLGFAPVEVVERWERPAMEGAAAPAGVAEWELDAALDRAAFGADRRRLLESLARAGAATAPGAAAAPHAAALPDGSYAMGRAGARAAYFGPCVARSAAAARQLLGWFLARHAGEAVYWDLLTENGAAVEMAAAHGFRRARTLTRMVRELRSGGSAADSSLVFATAGLEFG
jgi:GNAT superfamily N-acetyltransferase